MIRTPLARAVALPAATVGLALSLCVASVPAHSALTSGSGTGAGAELMTVSEAEAQQQVEEVVEPEDLSRTEAREGLAEQTAPTATDFYATPGIIPSEPGSLIRQEPMDFYVDPVKLVRYPATATRIMYSSINSAGASTAVTGTVLTPTKAWLGSGERPVIGFGVGTQGIADRCAPSRALSTGQEYEGLVISALLSSGYSVVVTDYEGLGTEGTHTYMARESQGHAVLDSLRAAAQVEGTGITAETPAALVGYSQGGGASASAAELAAEYAPELNLKGAYAGAVPADLFDAADNVDGTLYSEFLLFALAGQLTASGIDPADYLNADGLALMEEATENCTIDGLVEHAFTDSSELTLTGETLPELIRSDARLKAILTEQEIGRRAPEMPVVVTHSMLDDVIPYSTGKNLARDWCRGDGGEVAFDANILPTHIGGYIGGLPRMTAFLHARFSDWTPVDSCWRL